MRRLNGVTTVAGVLLIGASAIAAENDLLANADFHQTTDTGLPHRWTVVEGQKVTVEKISDLPGAAQALRVDVIADGGTSYGQVYQSIKAKPNTLYTLEGKVKSTKKGLGFLSVKVIKDRRELQRIGLAKSDDRWTTTTQEISTGEGDEIQVLCRWEQNAQRGWIGQTCWFTDLRLVEKGPAPPPPAWTAIIAKAADIKLASAMSVPLPTAKGDLYVTPEGAGRGTGADWANALPGNAPGALQAAWDALQPGQTCHVGSGIYVGVALTIGSGGTLDKPKRLAGEDTGGSWPWFVGTWHPSDPEKGPALLNLINAVGYCEFANLQAARYQYGMMTREGRHVGLRIRNFDVYEARHGIYLNGFVTADEAAAASHDIAVEDCDFIHFTKHAVRLQAGNYDVRFINCTADSGGKEWMKEPFQIGFDVAGDSPRKRRAADEKAWASDHDLIFINCIARNCIWSQDRYWQGDGFCIEGDVRNVAFIDCAALDCADGGWDIKAGNVVYVNCVGLRNKKNFRVWQHAFFYNCLSAYSYKHGGSWISSGLWQRGDVHAEHCTYHNNEGQGVCVEAVAKGEAAGKTEPHATLQNCLVSHDGVGGPAALYVDESRVTKHDTAEWLAASENNEARGVDPQYKAAATSRAWTGTPADAFDSGRYGPAKGYHSSIAAVWQSKSPDELLTIARALVKHQGWEDFLQQVTKLK